MACGAAPTTSSDVIEALGLDRPYAIGHSMGAGTVAAALAARPELIRAAVLEDPAWPEAPLDPAAAGTFMQAVRRLAVGQERRRARGDGRDDEPDVGPDRVRARGPSRRPRSAGADVIGASGVGRDDWRTAVRRVSSVRCCSCAGGNEARGRIVPPSVAAKAEELCPTLESVCLEQAGHNVRREAYDEYVAAVTAFLRRN